MPMRYPASTCAVALATALLATPAVAQVVDFSKYPDFRGQWDRTGPPNNWRQLAGPPPLTPEYQKVFDASLAEQRSGRPGNWPSTFCIPEGKYTALEVETLFLRGPRAYEASGIPFHEDNQTVIKERFYLDKADRNTLYDEITVIDHAMTRPYTKIQKAVRKPDPRPVWRLESCPLDNVWVKIG